jgi:glyoxylase-like metal-dependent hydrolase (beta-lactamase superfamily II)
MARGLISRASRPREGGLQSPGNAGETRRTQNLGVINIGAGTASRGDWSAWFAVEEVEPRTWLVAEPGHVNCFLVAGTERAVLVDTGLGIADLACAVGALTDRPVLAVNTHSHSDHRGGNWRFADVAAHPLAAGTLTQPVAAGYLADYLKVAREQLAAYDQAREADDRFFHLFTATTRPRPLPDDADQWTVPAGPAPRPLADGERISLGGRDLTVLHTPGHSPDSLCLLDERAGLLFAGDTLITGDFWAHTPDTEIEVFAATLRKLADELAGQLTAIYPAHTLRYRAGPAFLGAAADAFEAIVDGTSTGTPGTDLLLRPALRHEFAEFTVLRPMEAW